MWIDDQILLLDFCNETRVVFPQNQEWTVHVTEAQVVISYLCLTTDKYIVQKKVRLIAAVIPLMVLFPKQKQE